MILKMADIVGREDIVKKTVVLGVTGGIAAYKAAQLTSDLKKKDLDVHVIMTRNATEFVSPLTFETLSGHRVSVDTFDRNFEYHVQHVSLAKQADVFVVAPATANVIAKFAHGLADDMLTTTFLACSCPKIICPAMNTGMLENPATQENLRLLKTRGMRVVEADSGLLACGDVGKGRLAPLAAIEDEIEQALFTEKPLSGLKVLVSAGPTQEALDPVRYLTNHSSGKMGYALAKAARNWGAEVTLVHGPTTLPPVRNVADMPVTSAQSMAETLLMYAEDSDLIIKAAAVADYTPIEMAAQKIKKSEGEFQLTLKRTQDILKTIGERNREDQVVCGFAMETEQLLEHARAKLESKHADMIVANDLREHGAGFGIDTNRVTVLTAQGEESLPIMRKEELAYALLERCLTILKEKREK